MWAFHTIPHPGEYGYETWPKDAWKYVGGANTWGEISVDAQRGIAYFPTGSPTYDYYGADRIGSNLYANSLLALDARTGKRLWHYQVVHHDLWDYDLTAAPQLVTVKHGGKTIDAVAQAAKHGFLFVFDRVTGKPLWPIEERPIPKSEMPGEQTWPTQPFPTKPAAVRAPADDRRRSDAVLPHRRRAGDVGRAAEEGEAAACSRRFRPSTRRSPSPARSAAPTGATPPRTRPRGWSTSSARTSRRSTSCRSPRRT